jgi:DNA mismatch endonuclease (patch repair protein)
MVDVVSPGKRSRMMSNIKGKNTSPEMVVRRSLHALGFRYRLHDKTLPGKPDLVFPRLKAVIFVHGCFWHGHDCHLFKWPRSNTEFWREKIEKNRIRDKSDQIAIAERGWRQLVVWECAFRGKYRWPTSEVMEFMAEWLSGKSSTETADFYEIGGLTR